MPSTNEWNSLVPINKRYETTNMNARRPIKYKPTHIVIHVTGTESVSSVISNFQSPQSVSAHYLVTKSGDLIQFVPDQNRAFHAGVDSNTRTLYRKGASTWKRYLKHFNWYKSYPKDAVFVDGDLKPVWDRTEAVFVARSDGNVWPHYAYFDQRWGNIDVPVNFATDSDPNNYSIGIETQGFGGPIDDANTFPPAMYDTLRRLVQDLSVKHGISMQKGQVVGHEDVNPIGRFGWDPGQGFNWKKVFA